ncbi:PREDICTED: uncharacterized protein LOC105556476, partial [Vollenhovia emeryi]|uniref:uncharacterized protein LOC105556476 n=1 Tax=Vollenhovia emeryi TaxID=411798 RepID=UPI0005F3FE81
IIFVAATENKFDFEYQKKSIDNKDGVEATCKAEGLYPQPTLDISVKDVPEKQTLKPTVTLRKDGLYNILSRVDFLDEELPEAAELKCIIDIPRTNYSMTRKTIYYSGTATTTSSVTTMLQHQMDIQALDISKPSNGGGKIESIVKFIKHVYLISNHYQ